jgi:hypothetical protein
LQLPPDQQTPAYIQRESAETHKNQEEKYNPGQNLTAFFG